jgi:hypothetical protein
MGLKDRSGPLWKKSEPMSFGSLHFLFGSNCENRKEIYWEGNTTSGRKNI